MRRIIAALTILVIGMATIAYAYGRPQADKTAVTYSEIIDDDEIPKGGKPGYGHFPKFLADVNGDGIRDFCRAVGDVPPTLACQIGKPAGGFKTLEFQGPNPKKIKRLDWWGAGMDKKRHWMEDVNDDDRADYCRYVGTRYVATLAEEDGFAEELVRIRKTTDGWRLVE